MVRPHKIIGPNPIPAAAHHTVHGFARDIPHGMSCQKRATDGKRRDVPTGTSPRRDVPTGTSPRF